MKAQPVKSGSQIQPILHRLFWLGFILLYPAFSFRVFPPCSCQAGTDERTDTLPDVFPVNHSDLNSLRLKLDAARLFNENQLPDTKAEWIIHREKLISEIIRRTGVVINHELPLNLKETGRIQLNGYSIRNVFFQTRPGVYATANLYIPDGKGIFPGVIVMMGHSSFGRLEDNYQSVGHTLALNGYVALCMDPWGAGERTTIHGVFEDHGDENNLGSSLMNIGEPLMGIEISDNLRGVDLLCSLPYVDDRNLGATGSSGGGNQTMWLAALDTRVKAAVPVVSAGTFESYIMGTPCICEVLPGGLNLTEEAGILSLVAPRAIKMCNHQKDNNQAFRPSEMIRSYSNARSVFKMVEAQNNISYQLFDLTHGYFPEDRQAMLGWFDLHLKNRGEGAPKSEIPFELLPKEKLMVFPKGERDARVIGTVNYCKLKGKELRDDFLGSKCIDAERKRAGLKEILGIRNKRSIRSYHEFFKQKGWSRISLETSDNRLIPVLLRLPSGKGEKFTIVCNPDGKQKIPAKLLDSLISRGQGIAVIDLSGTGEVNVKPNSTDKNRNLLILSRSLLWFGKTLIGEWVNELELVSDFLQSSYHAVKIGVDAYREAGVAALFLAALEKKPIDLNLRETPVSYLFDKRENIDFFSVGINVPGMLRWGDISLVAAMSRGTISFIDPVTMSGRKITGAELDKYRLEFENIRTVSKGEGNTLIIESDKNRQAD